MGMQLYISVLLWGLVASASPCTDGSREIISGTLCSAYQECVRGKLHLKNCPPNYKFDTNSSSCIHRAVFKCTDVGKCDQEFYPHPTLSSAFYKCANGRISAKVCPAGEAFDSVLATCRPGRSYERPDIRKSAGGSCEEGVRMVSCKEYAVCSGGKLYVRRCPLGEVFDDNSKACTAGSCSHRPKRAATAACEEGTRRRVDGECKKYTQCVNGQEVEKSCSPCTNFDDAKQLCTFVFENPCSGNPTAPPTDPTAKPTTDPPTDPTSKPTTDPPTEPTSKPTTDPPTEPTSKPTTDPPTEPTSKPTTDPPTEPTSKPTTDPPTEPTSKPTTDPPTDSTPTVACVEGEKKPDLKNCQKYLECSKGTFVSESCFFLKHFDMKTLSCSWFVYTCAK